VRLDRISLDSDIDDARTTLVPSDSKSYALFNSEEFPIPPVLKMVAVKEPLVTVVATESEKRA